MTEPIRKILLIRLDHMGDAILMAPMLDALRRRCPDAAITCLVSSRTYPVFEHDRRIDQLATFDLHGASGAEKRRLAGWVRRQGFDLVIALTEKFWAAMWSLYSGAPLRIGFDAGLYQPLQLLWRLPAFNHRIRTQNDPHVVSPFHEVQRYLRLLEPLGVSVEAGPITVGLDPAAAAWAHEQWERLELSPAAIPVGVHFCEMWGTEGWQPSLALDIIDELLRQDERIVVIGTAGPGEAALLEHLQGRLPTRRFRLVSGMTFSQWVELVKRFRAYLSYETGSAHIGAAAGVPTAMVFPWQWYLHRSSRWHPWGVPYRTLRRPLPSDPAAHGFAALAANTVRELI